MSRILTRRIELGIRSREHIALIASTSGGRKSCSAAAKFAAAMSGKSRRTPNVACDHRNRAVRKAKYRPKRACRREINIIVNLNQYRARETTLRQAR
jgi:hypothetical protein